MLRHLEHRSAETQSLGFPPLLTDDDLARILVMTTDWVRSHAHEIPGFHRFGRYFRFHRLAVEQWLGSLDPLFQVKEVGELLGLRDPWVYAHADEIPGVLRLGHYIRFRPTMLKPFLNGSDAPEV